MTEAHINASSDGSRIAELVELASQTTSRLEILWDEVGYTSDEKRRQMKGLIDGFRTLCENKEKQEQGVKGQFIASIAAAKERIRAARGVLGLENTEDCSTHDMSLTDQLAYFEMEADAMKKMCTAQREKFAKLSDQIVHMSIVLGDDSDGDLDEWRDLDSCLSEARLLRFKERKDSLNKATELRTQTVASIVRSVQELMEELKIIPNTVLDERILGSLAVPSPTGIPVLHTTERTSSSVGISRAALDEIVARQRELLAQRDARREKLERMGEEILDLWQQLGISKEHQDVFALSVDGMGVQTLEVGEKELYRLRQIKRERMGDLIHEARLKIRELWDEMGYSDAQMSEYKPIEVTDESFTDELLVEHNQEIENLSAKLGTMKHILEKIEEREALVVQRIDNETSRKDPSRLTTRGSTVQKRREQQRRLQEELEAEKRVKTRLPVLTSSLAKIIPQWESAHQSHFMYKGERYLDALRRSEEEYVALKDRIKAEKEERKKEEWRRLAMASPGPQSLNAVALGRDTPRSVRKAPPGSDRKAHAAVNALANAQRIPMPRAMHFSNADMADPVTPERKHVEPSVSQQGQPATGISTITDVSNKMDRAPSPTQKQKQIPYAGGEEDTENDTIDSF